ncbi:hypothetical protein ABT026_01265 [Streptomyces sp. NPDC002734]|uniref:hypothetical protein n=1 Tax=Streptomyces sp. NPDC002734 TaxID=3154426 RepID=UPI0033242A21
MSDRDETGSLLVRDLMQRVTDDLPPLPDLAPGAVRAGRRRRARARITALGGITALAAAGVFVLTALPRPPGGAAAPAVPATAPSPYFTPVHIEPSPGEQHMANLPAAERDRLAGFQQRVAASLNATLGTELDVVVRPQDDRVDLYRMTTDRGTFLVRFTVAPRDPRHAPSCREVKGARCEAVALPGGTPADVRVAPVNDVSTTGIEIFWSTATSEVALAVLPDDERLVSAPVSVAQITAAARDEALLAEVRYADRHPVAKKSPPVPGA